MSSTDRRERSLSPLEVFGLSPLGPGLRQCWAAVAGDAYSKPSRFGLSSIKILKPTTSLRLWKQSTTALEKRDRTAWIYNLPNRHILGQARKPSSLGYSVRVTGCRDFRGGQLTYDGHVGTDFAVPAGTPVSAAASGVVVRVSNDMQRGGLKVWIDHGFGLLTSSNHLSRAFVSMGQEVARGEVIGLSGMSGVDGLLFFPWLAPHLHFNVLLNGHPVDPWAKEGEVSLWQKRNAPTPASERPRESITATRYSEEAVHRGIEACMDDALRRHLFSLPSLALKGGQLAAAQLLQSQRFSAFIDPIVDRHERTPHLSLPFRTGEIDEVRFLDG